jgi:ubiquinone/menaquinone biosynthesis C-methylase UbiE
MGASPPAGRQADIDKANMAFWDELCGSTLARRLGVTDSSPESLKRFDDWYMDYYPYLERHIPFETMQGKRVLEIGLGYGTVAQRLMEAGADYHGLDIAANPVVMARHRLDQLGKQGTVQQGSVLQCPFEDSTFDWVITVGCLHHTGDLAHAIKEVHRVLKPSGRALVMVYNAASYRQLSTDPWTTIKLALGPGKRADSSEAMRRAYDSNKEGDAAPQTEFVTARQLRYLCRDFRSCCIRKENIGRDGWFKKSEREKALRYYGPYLGLDLYASLKK